MSGRIQRWLVAAVLGTAAFFLVNAVWIPAKAQLAQILMEHAWQKNLAGDVSARPWPWADTSPVAVIEVSRLGVRQFVLEGASGRNLAFGPTALTAVMSPDLILSGHRDTHFSWIKDLIEGDLVHVTTTYDTREFRVSSREVVDSRLVQLVKEDHYNRLTLVTCYPFNTPVAGGPLRFVITAAEIG